MFFTGPLVCFLRSQDDLAEGGGFSSRVPSPRWHRVIIPLDTYKKVFSCEDFPAKERNKLLTTTTTLIVDITIANNCSWRQNTNNLPCRARAQGSNPRLQLRRSNGIQEQRFGCYANGRRARVPGGTHPKLGTLGFVDIRDSKKARTLSAARGSE
jgi:hypothetical protein